MEMELVSGPFGVEGDLVLEVVDDEASNAVYSGIVPRNKGEGSMHEPLTVGRVIVKDAIDHIQRCLLVGDVTEVDGVDLGEGGDRHRHRYS